MLKSQEYIALPKHLLFK